MFFQHSIGIDIRDDRVCLVHLKATLTGVRPAGEGTWRLDPADSIDQRLKEARDRIESYFTSNGVDAAEVCLSIPADVAMHRMIEMPWAVRENLHGTLKYELDKYLPFSAEDVYLDAQIVSEQKEKKKIQILLMAVKRETLDPYIAFAKDLSTGVCGIETSATAMANYLCRHSRIASSQPSVFIIRDREKIEFGFLKKGKLHHIRLLNDAEGNKDPGEWVRSELQALIPQLDPTKPHLYLFEAGFNGEDGLKKSLSEQERPEISELTIPGEKRPDTPLAPAYGLASTGIRKNPTRINFLPPAFRKKPARGGFYIMALLAFLIVVAGTAWSGSHVLKKQMAIKQLDERLATLKTEIAKINELETEIARLENSWRQLNSIRQGYIPVIDVLRELTERIPDTAFCKEVLFSKESFQIVGSAESATEILSLLSESGLFKNVAFLSAITKDKDGKEQFRIGFNINGKEAN